MTWMVNDYIDHAQATNQHPDLTLIDPIIAKLNELNAP